MAKTPASDLRHRLRNPPAHFVARRRETDDLISTIKRAPVSIVWGLGGLGKTSLLLHVLHSEFASAVPRTLAFDARPDASSDETLTEIARAIGGHVSGKRPRWAETAKNRAALLITAIDLADAHDLWVMLDDAHNMQPETLAEMLGIVAGYARSSRWLFVSRVRPEATELASQMVQVSPMEPAALAELCQHVAPSWSESDVARAAQAAAGSPWRLLQLAAHRQTSFAETLLNSARQDLFAGLDAPAQDLLLDLCLVERPLPLLAVALHIPRQVIDMLDYRGLIELSADAHVRLHDVARGLLRPTLSADEPNTRASRLAETLRTRPESSCAIEAIALFLRTGLVAQAATLCQKRGPELASGGNAPRLWHLLEAQQGEEFQSTKYACALALEGGPALTWLLAQPAPIAVDDCLVWVKALSLSVQSQRVLDESQALERAALAAQRSDIAAECVLLRAEALCNVTRPADSADILATLVTDNPMISVRRDSILARARLLLGHSHEAAHAAPQLVARFLALGTDDRRQVFADLVGLLTDLGRVRDAIHITEETDDITDFVYQHHVHHQIELGHLEEGVRAYARLLPFSRWPPLYAIPLRLLYTQLCIMRGDFTSLAGHVLETIGEAERLGNREFIVWTLLGAYLLAIQRGQAPVAISPSATAVQTTGPEWYFLRALMQVHAMRTQGEVPGDGFFEPEAVPEIIDIRCNWERAFAMRAMLQGDLRVAERHAHAMFSLAEANGLSMYFCEGLILRSEVALLAGNIAEVKACATELTRQAAAMRSMIYAAEAEFMHAVIATPCLDASVLERLAGLDNTAPIAARRARALLGRTTGDAYDQRIIEAINRSPFELVRIVEAAGTGGWGLDDVRKQVWFADRPPVDMTKQKQSWELLRIIAETREIDKEALVIRIWSPTEYHPLRDDKRLQVALSRLRDTLGDDAGMLIETTASGYRVSPHLALTLLRAKR